MEDRKSHLELNAHACGAWRGMLYANNREAFISAYRNGFRHIEVDVACSNDGQFVISHGFFPVEKYSVREFLSRSSFRTGTRMLLADVFALMHRFPDCNVMFDFHPGLYDRNCPRMMKRFAGQFLDDAIRGRSIIEVYSEVNALAVLETGFRNVQFGWMDGSTERITLAPPPPLDDFRTCMRFCKDQGIRFVSVPAAYLLTHHDDAEFLRLLGVIVYSGCVNTYEGSRRLCDFGVNVVTTDFLVPGGLFRNYLFFVKHWFWRGVRNIAKKVWS